MRIISWLFSSLIFAAPLAAQSVNPNYQINWGGKIYYSQAGDTISSIEAACTTDCTYVVSGPQTITLAADHTLSSNVSLQFEAGGLWTVAGGHILTISAGVDGTLNQHFAGATVKFGNFQSRVPVEWFGAVGDWNGFAGTDNTAAIQACINSLFAGQCVIQAQSYKISSVLTYNRSNTGLRGQTRSVRSPTIYTAPTGSILITTSTTANLINVTGTSISNTLAFNQFNDFTLERSAAATTDAARGMQFNFTYGALVEGVVSEDSPGGFFMHATGSQDLGGFINDVAAWGYAGFTPSSGSYCGFCLDSADGASNPSLRIFGSGVFSALGAGVTTVGISSTGRSLNDLHVDNFETSGVSFGQQMIMAASPLSALDIHFTDVINDTCQISCMYFTTGGAPAAITITGGWNFRAGTNTAPVIDLEGASNVTIDGVDLYFPTAGPGVLANGGNNNTITNSHFLGAATSSAVSAISGTFLTVTNNQMPNITATNIISFAGVTHGIVSGNNISGTGTNGILLDASTHGIAGLPANAISGTFTSALSDLGVNPTTVIYFQINPGVSAKPACTSPIEGMLWYIAGSGATNGTFQICQNQSGSFLWVNH